LAYLIIGLVLAVLAAGFLGWRLVLAKRSLDNWEARCHNLQRDRAIRQNLEHILSGREAELKRLRAKLRQYEADAQALESRASELNLTLFRESGLRILAEKEDGARRMKMDLMERQLDEANRRLREFKAQAEAREGELNAEITRQQAEIDRLKNPRGRRAARHPVHEEGWDQITLDDVLGSRE